MEFLYPEKRIGYEKVRHLMLAVIKYLCAPVRMFTLSRIRIFICTCSVKKSKTVCIFREMCRYPVKNYPNSFAVHIIHKIHKVLRSTVSGCRSIISGYLISPRAVKGIFRYSHQLDMGISHMLYIFCKFMCKLPVIKKSVLCSVILLLP